MSTESIKFLIDAENRASKKIRAVTKDIESQVKQVRDVGSKAKASTELVGSFASAMGSSGIGRYSSELATLTERVSAFSEVARDGGTSSLAFKAGLAGVVAVGGYQLGQALSGSAEAAKILNQELERTIKLEQGFLDIKQRGEAFEQFQIGLLGSAEAQRDAIEGFIKTKQAVDSAQAEKALEAAKDSLSKAEAVQKFNRGRMGMFEGTSFSVSSIFGDSEEITKAQASIKSAQVEVDRLKKVTMNARDQVKRLNAQMMKDGKEDFAKSMTDGVTRFVKAYGEGLKANSAKEAAENKAKEAAEKRIQDLKQSTLDKIKLQAIGLRDGEEAARSMALQMQGLDKASAMSIAGFEEQLRGLSKSKMKDATSFSSMTRTAPLRGVDDRFGSGKAERQAELRDRRDATNANSSSSQKDENGKQTVDVLTKILEQLTNQQPPIQVSVNGR